jgi:hypothetical protein
MCVPGRVLEEWVPGEHLKIKMVFLARHTVEFDCPVPFISGVHQA